MLEPSGPKNIEICIPPPRQFSRTFIVLIVAVIFVFVMLVGLQHDLNVANRKLTCIHNLLTESDPSACDQDYIFN